MCYLPWIIMSVPDTVSSYSLPRTEETYSYMAEARKPLRVQLLQEP